MASHASTAAVSAPASVTHFVYFLVSVIRASLVALISFFSIFDFCELQPEIIAKTRIVRVVTCIHIFTPIADLGINDMGFTFNSPAIAPLVQFLLKRKPQLLDQGSVATSSLIDN